MDLTPLFLLLLLPPTDATGDLANALEASLHSELGDVAMAMAPDRLVTPAMMEGENPPYRARFVAHVTWAGRDKASIEVQSTGEAKTPYRASRVVTFSPRDRKAERGRAIGLVIAGLLRDSPPAIFGTASTLPSAAPSAAAEPIPRGLAIGALFSVQRARSGMWPVGPVLSFDASLSDAVGLNVGVGVLATDDYWQVPMAVQGRWRFLRSDDGRRALAIGLGVVLLHESMSQGGEEDDGGNAAQWNIGGVAGLSGHVTLGRSLRLLAQVEMQALARQMMIQAGEDRVISTTAFARWRPAFGLGLAYSM
jgi:hypothetical protein